MNQPTKTSILNYKTVDLLRQKLYCKKARPEDFLIIEDLLEAFDRPRDLILDRLRPYAIFSYEEFLAAYESHSVRGLGSIMGTTLGCLDNMAQYFLRKENGKPKPWVLKNPNAI